MVDSFCRLVKNDRRGIEARHEIKDFALSFTSLATSRYDDIFFFFFLRLVLNNRWGIEVGHEMNPHCSFPILPFPRPDMIIVFVDLVINNRWEIELRHEMNDPSFLLFPLPRLDMVDNFCRLVVSNRREIEARHGRWFTSLFLSVNFTSNAIYIVAFFSLSLIYVEEFKINKLYFSIFFDSHVILRQTTAWSTLGNAVDLKF